MEPAPNDPTLTYRTWNPASRELPPLEREDVVVHLARSPLPTRWSSDARESVLNERTRMVAAVVDAIAASTRRPSTFICASSHDYYGDRSSDLPLNESEPPGNDFLARLYAAIESEALRATDFGVRVALPRIGAVIGPGAQNPKWIVHVVRDPRGALSWVELGDAIEMLRWTIEMKAFEGAVNVTAPEPTTANALRREIDGILESASTQTRPANALQRLRHARTASQSDQRLHPSDDQHVTFQSHWAYPEKFERQGFKWQFSSPRPALAFLKSASRDG
jgi:NAD dependent epimerase/dehydratase family enzyme